MLWQRLFSGNDTGVLDRHEIKGLTGELLCLERLLLDQPDSKTASVLGWTGPLNADQDFMFTKNAIEVKAVSATAKKVGIASPSQLECRVPLELRVYFLKECAPGEPGFLSLPVMVARIESQLSSLPLALECFRERLLKARFVDQAHYEAIGYVQDHCNRYAVQHEFPRLHANQIPAAVTDVTFSLVLAALAPFLMPVDSQHAD